ncbi:MAG: SdpI family protein [Proteobacteria bacterium]|nr:SdpI family protein [Pseudomonadota bacterium]
MLLRRYWLSLLLLALMVAAPLVVYGRLPATVPAHWSAAGAVDGYAPRALVAFLMPALGVLVFALLLLAPRLSPRGFDMDSLSRVYPPLVAGIVAFQGYVSLQLLRAALGEPVRMDQHLLVLVGLLLALVGNYLGKATRNFFFGIRTPWTLADERIWERTHRLAAPLFVAGGALLIAAGVAGATAVLPLLAVVALVIAVPVGYSYRLWRRLERLPPR